MDDADGDSDDGDGDDGDDVPVRNDCLLSSIRLKWFLDANQMFVVLHVIN